MYSKNKGITDRNYTLTPPPGYDGSRFRLRSDGRDDSFPLYEEEPFTKHVRFPEGRCQPTEKQPIFECPCIEKEETECKNQETVCEETCCHPHEEVCDCPPCEAPIERKKDMGILSFLQNLGGEETLLIALIVLIAGSQSRAGMETVLILTLLLCVS